MGTAAEGDAFGAAVAAVRPSGDGAPVKRSHHKKPDADGIVKRGPGRPPKVAAEPAPPPAPPVVVSAEEAGAFLKQLDGMIAPLVGTRPLSAQEVDMAGRQLAPVMPELLAKLTPGTVAIAALALLYVPRIVEVWASKRAAAQAGRGAAVSAGQGDPQPKTFPSAEMDGGAATVGRIEPKPPTDSEALALGVVQPGKIEHKARRR